MMKPLYYLATILLLMLWFEPAMAQQKPAISQYMFSGLLLNPAYAGRHEYTSFTAMYRDQWVNVPGSPKTTTLTGQTGFKDRNIGAGFLINEDKIGVHSNLSAYGSYAYFIKFRNGAKFSMGLQGGVDILRSDWSKLTTYDQDDPLFAGSEINYFPNFGTGFFYFSEDLYVGLSVPYILSGKKTTNDDFYRNIRHSRNYYLTAGKVFDLSPKLKFKPSMLLRVEDNMPLAIDLNANLFYDEIIDVGLSYRQGDAIIAIMGLQLNKYMKFSYAYDYITSKLTTYTKGTHELMLQYRINFHAPRHNRMCPQPQYF
ncbi:MAG: type IX secretion system membrane protein PorP/SprF [Cyclobacteriaceae bacterium]|nr:type IX secretion system membrane protein PorP/SprF [Cyclobacteriaceae bacterium]